MQIIAIIGAFGAGKSTCAMALARTLNNIGYGPTEVAIVVNEVGGMTEIRTPHARVVILPNGCFTCEDEATFTKELSRLEKEGVKVVVMEGFGIVSGEETATFLRTTEYLYAIIGVIDGQKHETNRTLYGNLLPTHVSAATAGVIVTKCVGGEVPGPVLEFLRNHTQVQIVPLEGVPELLPRALVDQCMASSSQRRLVMHCAAEGCVHHHHLPGQDHQSQVHDWNMYAMTLRADVTVEGLQAVLNDHVVRGEMRAKGVAGSNSFNAVPGSGEWNVNQTSPGETPFLVLYVASGVSVDYSLLMPMVEEAKSGDNRRSYLIIRDNVSNLPELVRLIEEGIYNICNLRPVPTAQGFLVTHPEPLQLTKEISRRPQVKEVWFFLVIEACIRYWVACTEFLASHGDDLNPVGRETSERELGVSLAWWAVEFQDKLPPELYNQVAAVAPALLVARGLEKVQSLRADAFWRYWQMTEYLRALDMDLPPGNERGEFVQAARARILKLLPELERSKFE